MYDPMPALRDSHRDRFDPMLIDRTRAAGLTPVTHDRLFEPYGLDVMRM
jgi:PIN domain nuclease of toxin-antitoxin system